VALKNEGDLETIRCREAYDALLARWIAAEAITPEALKLLYGGNVRIVEIPGDAAGPCRTCLPMLSAGAYVGAKGSGLSCRTGAGAIVVRMLSSCRSRSRTRNGFLSMGRSRYSDGTPVLT
jgi:hypothetical protein